MPIPEAEVMVDWALSKTGSTYRAKDPDRWIYPDVFDCSSLGVRAHRAAGVDVPEDVRNTVGIYNWAARIGALVSIDKAIRTRGAGLLKGKNWGFGAFGHYAVSLGDGNEMAAHGRRSGVHPGPVNRGFYQDGIILPASMMHYADLDPPIDPAAIAALKKLREWQLRVEAHPLHLGDHNGDVTILNQLLISRALLARNVPMNTYTTKTRDAVVHFKKLEKLSNTVGHTFGGEAAAAILKPN